MTHNNEEDLYYKEVFARTALIVGSDAIRDLRDAKVLVCGLGGVGSHAATALARSGVGSLVLCDGDVIVKSNINRQIEAFIDTVGLYKTEAMRDIIKKINPYCNVEIHTELISQENTSRLIDGCDYVIDAIDTVGAKLELICRCESAGVGIVSCMGTGNKLFPERLELTDIYITSICPLAKVMRSELRKRGVKGLTVCYSKETPVNTEEAEDFASEEQSLLRAKRRTVGSTAFVPAAAGYILAAHVARELMSKRHS